MSGVVTTCPHCHAVHVCKPESDEAEAACARVPWRRILYAKQPYPDNYVDSSFLSTLVTNANVRPQQFWSIARDTVAVSQRTAVMVIFGMVFHQSFEGSLSAQSLVVVDVVLMLLASLAFVLLGGAEHRRRERQTQTQHQRQNQHQNQEQKQQKRQKSRNERESEAEGEGSSRGTETEIETETGTEAEATTGLKNQTFNALVLPDNGSESSFDRENEEQQHQHPHHQQQQHQHRSKSNENEIEKDKEKGKDRGRERKRENSTKTERDIERARAIERERWLGWEWEWLGEEQTQLLLHVIRQSAAAMRRLTLFSGLLLGLSPVLKTLTLSYSSDTIWALSLCLALLHLVTHDFAFINQSKTGRRVCQQCFYSTSSASASSSSTSSSSSKMRRNEHNGSRPDKVSHLRIPTSLTTTTVTTRQPLRIETLPSSSSLSPPSASSLSSSTPLLSSLLPLPRPPSSLPSPYRSRSSSSSSSSFSSSQSCRHNFSVELQGTISLNAGIFASLLLASRLSSNLHVFAFMLLAFELCAGFPLLAHQARKRSFRHHLALTALLVGVALHMVITVSKLMAFVFVFWLVVVSLACPMGLLWVQRYKNEMQGPWDYDDTAEMQQENF